MSIMKILLKIFFRTSINYYYFHILCITFVILGTSFKNVLMFFFVCVCVFIMWKIRCSNLFEKTYLKLATKLMKHLSIEIPIVLNICKAVSLGDKNILPYSWFSFLVFRWTLHSILLTSNSQPRQTNGTSYPCNRGFQVP